MALTVNTNVSALNAQRQTEDSRLAMQEAMERLASGKRINSARDDAAGLAISARMQSQISGLNQASRNANDAISLVQTAEGALQEYTEVLQRIRELAIQAANGAATNADRVNLHKEVSQLQEELSRIANTTRFNGEILLNGSFTQKDFQIGQSNQEEISVNIDDLRPERIGAYSQQTMANVGNLVGSTTRPNLAGSGQLLADIDNGVAGQTISVRVGDEAARTVSINKGDDARTIADKINQSGAQVNSKAITTVDLYVRGTAGTFSFELSSSASSDLVDTISVGPDGDYVSALAAEVNARFPDHNISASIESDANGVQFIRLTQSNGYDIQLNKFSTSETSSVEDVTLDVGGSETLILNNTNRAVAMGGSVTIDAPYSFLMTTDDATNSVVPTTKPSLLFDDISVDVTNWSGAKFTINHDDGDSVADNDIDIEIGTLTTADNDIYDVVAEINADLTAAGADVRVEFEPDVNRLAFYTTGGASTEEASLTVGRDPTDADALDFVAVGFTTDSNIASVSDLGGNTNPPESVRYVSQIDIATRDSAVLTMTVVDAALEAVSANRAELGAVANRLESTIQNLMTTSENTSASLSRIMDADFAAESTALARAQVLQQASVAMLAQANASTQTVLRLLE